MNSEASRSCDESYDRLGKKSEIVTHCSGVADLGNLKTKKTRQNLIIRQGLPLLEHYPLAMDPYKMT